MKMNQAIQEFVNSAIESGYVSKEDRSYLLNRVLLFSGRRIFWGSKEINQPSLLEAMANWLKHLLKQEDWDDAEERDWLEQELMNLVDSKTFRIEPSILE